MIYCSRAYNLYSGLSFISKAESVKAHKMDEQQKAEEAERQLQIAELEGRIHTLKLRMDEIANISLLNVQVHHQSYGSGTVIAQKETTITVKFSDVQKSFMINKKFTSRPSFEHDEEIVSAFTEYDEAKRQIKLLQLELDHL